MPLIIVSGLPSSGKTTRTNEIASYFKDHRYNVTIISETEAIFKAGFEKDTFFLDSHKEKHIRGVLKSDVQRAIGPENVVILDAGNYIKGYRYELYCTAKANKCTQCTVHCDINVDKAYELNQQRASPTDRYSKTTFDALVMRYESPDGRNRWDAPLFVVFPENSLDLRAVQDCLFNKAPPPPNMSTQNPPLSSTNFLYELDRLTQEIDKTILSAKRMGFTENVRLPGVPPEMSFDCSEVNAPQLTRLRRQFISYTKMHTTEMDKIPILYIQYLKSSLNV